MYCVFYKLTAANIPYIAYIALRILRILRIIIQQIVTLSKYGHDALDIRHP